MPPFISKRRIPLLTQMIPVLTPPGAANPIAFIGATTFETFDGTLHTQTPIPPVAADLRAAWIDADNVVYAINGRSGGVTTEKVYTIDLDVLTSWATDPKNWPARHWAQAATQVTLGRDQWVHVFGGHIRAGTDVPSLAHYSLPSTFPSATGLSDDAIYAARTDLQQAGVHLGGMMYVTGGGITSTSSSSRVDRWPVQARDASIPGTQWVQVASMASTRRGHAAVTDGRYLYVLGGHSGASTDVRQAERYDPKTNTWASLGGLIPLTAGDLLNRAGIWWAEDNALLYFVGTTVWTYDLTSGLTGSWTDEAATYNPSGITMGTDTRALNAPREAGNDEALGHFLPSQVAIDTVNFATGGTTSVGGSSVTVNAPVRDVGDTLWAVVTTVAGSDGFTATGWTNVAFLSGSHRTWVFKRQATNTSADNLTFTQTVTCAISICMAVTQKSWVNSWTTFGIQSDGTSRPWGPEETLGTGISVGWGPCLLLVFFSIQNNSGTTGIASDLLADNGNLLCSSWGGRASFKGVANGIMYKTGVGATASPFTATSVKVDMDISGGREFSTAARYLAALHMQA